MARIVVRALTCLETTSGPGSDQVYMIVFRGAFGLPLQVKVVGGKNTAWGDMDKNKTVLKDMVVDDSYSAGHAYVAVMLEQDYNIDFLTGVAGAGAIEYWANNWSRFNSNGWREVTAFNALFLNGAMQNDDYMSARTVPQIFTEGGSGAAVIFEGDGGKYRARFAMRP